MGVADKVQISVVESDKSSDRFNCYLNEIRLLGIVNDTHMYTVSTAYMSLSHSYDITVFCIDGLYLITHAIAADHLSLSNYEGCFFSTSDRASKEVRNTREPDLRVA